jgi:hypothetical protein
MAVPDVEPRPSPCGDPPPRHAHRNQNARRDHDHQIARREVHRNDHRLRLPCRCHQVRAPAVVSNRRSPVGPSSIQHSHGAGDARGVREQQERVQGVSPREARDVGLRPRQTIAHGSAALFHGAWATPREDQRCVSEAGLESVGVRVQSVLSSRALHARASAVYHVVPVDHFLTRMGHCTQAHEESAHLRVCDGSECRRVLRSQLVSDPLGYTAEVPRATLGCFIVTFTVQDTNSLLLSVVGQLRRLYCNRDVAREQGCIMRSSYRQSVHINSIPLVSLSALNCELAYPMDANSSVKSGFFNSVGGVQMLDFEVTKLNHL